MTAGKDSWANASARIKRGKYQLFLSILTRQGIKYKHWLENQIDREIDETQYEISEMPLDGQPITVDLPFDGSHTVAIPLRHADRQLWIHECQLQTCGRQWWSYTKEPQHCPSCGSRLWRGTSEWERRRGNLSENP